MEAGGEIFEARERLLRELGWNENPFVKDLRAFDDERFLKFYYPLEGAEILQKLAFDAKAVLLLGPKGVGKTSALYYVQKSLPGGEFRVHLFKEPPASLDDLAAEAGYSGRGGLVEGVLGLFGQKPRPLSRQELAERVKAERLKVVWFVDEAHLAKSEGMYMEFKYLLDEVPNLRIVFSALGKDNFPDSLLHLIGAGNVLSRKGFSSAEMRAIVEHRIRAVGGAGLKPFTPALLEEVFTTQNLLSPRYVFDELNDHLAKLALHREHKLSGVPREYRDNPLVVSAVKAAGGLTTTHAAWWNDLSPSQKTILELLLKSEGGLSLADIQKETKLSQNTAFNALYQLRGEDAAEKKRKPGVPFPLIAVKQSGAGKRKKNAYFASEKIRNLFTLT